MQASVRSAFVFVLGSLFVPLAPAVAAAQRDADPLLLGSPRPADEDAPSRSSARGPHDPAGWAMFGGHLGFFASLVTTTSLILLTQDDPEAQQTVGVSVVPTTAGLTVGGAFLFSKLARHDGWDEIDGWGATGIFPGAMGGLALAGGALLSVDDDPPVGVRLAAALAGALAGGYLGLRAFHEMAARRAETGKGAGSEVFGFWAGFFFAEIVGIAIASRLDGGASQNAPVPLLLAATSGVTGALVAHQLASF